MKTFYSPCSVLIPPSLFFFSFYVSNIQPFSISAICKVFVVILFACVLCHFSWRDGNEYLLTSNREVGRQKKCSH